MLENSRASPEKRTANLLFSSTFGPDANKKRGLTKNKSPKPASRPHKKKLYFRDFFFPPD
jgi:hypothetical protein